jgi:uncharacterized metal-binding protein YceD (DUF177 family)
MGVLDDFKIQFSGLKIGDHDFELEADDRFFEALGHAPDFTGSVKINLILTKRPHMLELAFTMNGGIDSQCDRCSAAFAQPIMGRHMLYVKFAEGVDGEAVDDDMIILSPEAHEVDVAQFVFENIALSLPLRKVPCEDLGMTGLCDQEVLQMLEVQNKANEANPMWDALGKMKDRFKD